MMRKPHAKSRSGCRVCKQRHVKCDESGPPCANCAARGFSCSYGSNTGSVARSSRPPAESPCWDVSRPSRRLLELELLHRWSTTTYKAFSADPAELHVLQVDLPREALRYEWMMLGLYAVAALDAAVAGAEDPPAASAAVASADGSAVASAEVAARGGGPAAVPGARPRGTAGPPQLYLAAALEYYDRASAGYRAELCRICRDNHHVLWQFSVLAAVFHLALPPAYSTEPAALGRLALFLELYGGCAWVSGAALGWLVESSAPVRSVLAAAPAPAGLVPPDAAAALARLARLGEALSQAPGGKAAGRHDLYASSVAMLGRCFAEEAADRIKGFCMAWAAVMGAPFAGLLREPDHMALLLLMHWSVLVHRLPREAWWAQPMGRALVAEVRDLVWRSERASMPGWREGVAWVCERVGLPTPAT